MAIVSHPTHYMIKLHNLLLALIFIIHPSMAKWASHKDAPMEIEQYKKTIFVNADGSSTEKVQLRYKLSSTYASEKYRDYAIIYPSNRAKVTVLAASSTINGKKTNIDLTNIQTKPLANGYQQKLIAFPTKVGSVISLSYEQKFQYPVIQDFYEQVFDFGLEGVGTNINIYLSSELPFYININDPSAALDIKQYQKASQYFLQIKQKKPLFTKVINEADAKINPVAITSVHLSTIKTWQSFGERLQQPYTKVVRQRLPRLYAKIVKEASKAKTEAARVNIVTSLLSNSINYQKTSHDSANGLIPRDLQEVANSKYASSKDFATATVAMLSQMGIVADVALVNFGTWVYPKTSSLPGPSHFNHAIVKVTEKNRVYWIDPTRKVSIAPLTIFEISNRNALLITKPIPSLEYIADNTYQSNLIAGVQNISFSNIRETYIKGEISFLAKASASLLEYPANDRKQYILQQISPAHETIDSEVKVPLLNMLTQDLKVSYNFRQKDSFILTNAGKGFMLNSYDLDKLIAEEHRVSDIFLGAPRRITMHYILEKVQARGDNLPGINITSPWLDVVRKVSYGKNYIGVLDIITIKKSIINSPDLTSNAYQLLAKSLAEFFTNPMAIIFTSIKDN